MNKNNLAKLSSIFFLILLTASSVFANTYPSSDELLGNGENGGVLFDEPYDNIKTSINDKNNTTISLAISNEIKVYSPIPENVKSKVIYSLRKIIVSSGLFELVELDDELQKKLDNEIKRVHEHGISDNNKAELGMVSGIKYFVLISIIEFSAKEREFINNSKYVNGAYEIKARIGVELLDTSTRKIIVNKEVFSRVISRETQKENLLYDQKKGTQITPPRSGISDTSIYEISKKLSKKIIFKLANDLNKIHILKILPGEEVFVNVGEELGVKPGDLFDVMYLRYEERELLDKKNNVVVEIERVGEKKSLGLLRNLGSGVNIEPKMVLKKLKKQVVDPFSNSLGGIKVN